MNQDGGVLRVASFNVNGVRAFARSTPLSSLAGLLDCDVLCIQETKLSVGDTTTRDELAVAVPGFEAFFNTSTARQGYSGVAVFARAGLVHRAHDWFVEDECECDHCALLRKEGRVLVVELSVCVVVCLYCPNGGKEKNKEVPIKSEFLRRVRANVDAYHRQGRRVAVCGDLNVVARPIDIWYDLQKWEKVVSAGEPCMAPHIAQWLEDMITIDKGGLVDSFRHLHPKEVKFSWFSMKTDGRARGEGWRLDYILVSAAMQDAVEAADIVTQVRGSDHVPVKVALKMTAEKRADDAPVPALLISGKTVKMQSSILSFFGGGAQTQPKRTKTE